MSGWDSSDRTRPEQIRELFLKVLDASPGEWDAVLEESCGWDGELRREVEELLSAHTDADEVLWSLARRARVPIAGAPTDFFAEGRRLGAYRLLRQIGQGGMGAVYVAERADGEFEKQVAIKLLPLGLSTGTARERFLAERQILAQLEHPGIARLLDAGIADDGTPFFVMEYVEGELIDRFCERRNLGIVDRIDLFLQVCAAVEYAHRNLIVHRDLKPGNILVTPEGAVKLLDFGIAKVLDAEAVSGTTALTHQAGRPMTVAYASPEQVRGEPITTATDVYALGVLLYQLLAGRAPYEVEGLPPADLELLICTQEPIAPSAAVRARAAEPGSDPVPVSVSTAASKRARRLRGDLDTIVLMALRKEPERRYPSVAAFAEDLVRHREGRAVEARTNRISYRAGKFARRRPGVLAAMVAGVLVVGGFTVTLVRHAERLEVERDRARDAAVAAEVQAQKAERVTEFLAGLFAAADPGAARGQPVTVLQLLERGITGIDDLAADPQVQAELLAVFGGVQRSLGDFDQALELSERSLAIRLALFGEEHRAVAQSLNDVATLRRRTGDLSGAEEYHRRALLVRRQLLGGEHEDVAASLNNLGLLLDQKGDLDEAEKHLREALAIHERHYGSGDWRVAGGMLNLGTVLERKGDLQGAEEMNQRSLDLWRALGGADHPNVAAALYNLGEVFRLQGEYSRAVDHHLRALALWRSVLGQEHPNVASGLNALARAKEGTGDLDRAESAYREALSIAHNVFDEEHPNVVDIRANLTRLRQLGAGATGDVSPAP
jgi:eukaryotic-like serine/threonine-protein kinase